MVPEGGVLLAETGVWEKEVLVGPRELPARL